MGRALVLSADDADDADFLPRAEPGLTARLALGWYVAPVGAVAAL